MSRSATGQLGHDEPKTSTSEEAADSAAASAAAWAAYGRGEYGVALETVRLGLLQFPRDIDLLYVEGLALKRLDRAHDAARAFREALREIDQVKDKIRAAMLSRLLTGHINVLEQGAWNLEPETWTRV